MLPGTQAFDYWYIQGTTLETERVFSSPFFTGVETKDISSMLFHSTGSPWLMTQRLFKITVVLNEETTCTWSYGHCSIPASKWLQSGNLATCLHLQPTAKCPQPVITICYLPCRLSQKINGKASREGRMPFSTSWGNFLKIHTEIQAEFSAMENF